MFSCLHLVTEQFPHVREQATRLFECDDVLRELCEDYEVCTTALSQQPASAGLREEYAALQLRIETELLRHLQENAPRRRRG